MDAAQDLDKRALASPVLAGERMHPPAVKTEIDVAQNLDGPKAFRDPAKFNYRSHVKKKSGVAGVKESGIPAEQGSVGILPAPRYAPKPYSGVGLSENDAVVHAKPTPSATWA